MLVWQGLETQKDVHRQQHQQLTLLQLASEFDVKQKTEVKPFMEVSVEDVTVSMPSASSAEQSDHSAYVNVSQVDDNSLQLTLGTGVCYCLNFKELH